MTGSGEGERQRAGGWGDSWDDRVVLRSEFAMVELRVERSGNGPALRIRDTDTELEIMLDPLELEALTRMAHAEFGQLVVRDDPPAARS